MNNTKPFGLTIQSILPLPGCETTGDTPDVVIQYGAVPDSLPGATMIRACTQVRPGQFLLIVGNVARYLVEEGHLITIQPATGALDEEIRLFLMGSPWAALLLQRGLIPLHGCALGTRDGAIVLSGHSGNGKSTLAVALMDQGFPLIADELCAITYRENQPPLVLPGFPQILLWNDSLRKLEKDTPALIPVRPGLEKFILPCPVVSEPLPLSRLYILTVINTPDFTLTPIKGMNKIHALIDCTYRPHHVVGLGVQTAHFKQCAACAHFISVNRIERPSVPFDITGVSQLVTEDIE